MLEIDGSTLEGGGQIIRTATALSSITGKAVRIFNIRKGRPKPGLKTQHLEGLRALATLCNAQLTGDKLASTEIIFEPGKLSNKALEINIPTAGSIGLIFQVLALPASQLNEIVDVHVIGGSTFSAWSPPVPWHQNILLPNVSKTDYQAKIEIIKHGFYPRGDAEVKFTIEPWKEKRELNLINRGKLLRIKGVSIASEHLKAADVAERQAKAAQNLLKDISNIDIQTQYVPALNQGSGIILWAEFENTIIGSSALGERGKRAEDVGIEAAKSLSKSIQSHAALDKYMADQVLNWLAFCGGVVKVEEITMHARTNIWVIEQFLPVKFEIDEKNKIIICNV